MSFRKDNGFSKKLYNAHKILYLKTDSESICTFDSSGIDSALIRQLKEDSPVKIILNIETVQHIDSMFVGILIHLRIQCRHIGCELYLLGVSESVLKTLRLLNMSNVFNIINDVKDILEYIDHA